MVKDDILFAGQDVEEIFSSERESNKFIRMAANRLYNDVKQVLKVGATSFLWTSFSQMQFYHIIFPTMSFFQAPLSPDFQALKNILLRA